MGRRGPGSPGSARRATSPALWRRVAEKLLRPWPLSWLAFLPDRRSHPRRPPQSPWRLVGAGAPIWREQEPAGNESFQVGIGARKGRVRC